MYDCLQCGKLMPACRQTRITRAPLTLVVQLKRFSFSDGKSRRDNSNIKIFPNLLTLKAVSDGIIIKHSYRLRATINHQGSLESGHYWALVANSRCSFLKCDDFRVFETSRWDLNSESSYLLFFSRAEWSQFSDILMSVQSWCRGRVISKRPRKWPFFGA